MTAAGRIGSGAGFQFRVLQLRPANAPAHAEVTRKVLPLDFAGGERRAQALLGRTRVVQEGASFNAHIAQEDLHRLRELRDELKFSLIEAKSGRGQKADISPLRTLVLEIHAEVNRLEPIIRKIVPPEIAIDTVPLMDAINVLEKIGRADIGRVRQILEAVTRMERELTSQIAALKTKYPTAVWMADLHTDRLLVARIIVQLTDLARELGDPGRVFKDIATRYGLATVREVNGKESGSVFALLTSDLSGRLTDQTVYPVQRKTEDWRVYIHPTKDDLAKAFEVIAGVLANKFGQLAIEVVVQTGRDEFPVIALNVNRHLVYPLSETLHNAFDRAGVNFHDRVTPFSRQHPAQRGISSKHERSRDLPTTDLRDEIYLEIRDRLIADGVTDDAAITREAKRALEEAGYAPGNYHRPNSIPDPLDALPFVVGDQSADGFSVLMDGKMVLYTNVGKRTSQEDALAARLNPKMGEMVVEVDDGMGGHEAGEVASRTKSRSSMELFGENRPFDEAMDKSEMAVLRIAEEEVRRAHEFLGKASDAESRGDADGAKVLRAEAKKAFQRGAMGTCYFAVRFKYGFFGAGQGRGDLRWYHIRPRTGQIIQMNKDQNVATHLYVADVRRRTGVEPAWPHNEDGDYYTAFQNSPAKNVVVNTVILPNETYSGGGTTQNRPRLLNPGEKLNPRQKVAIPYKLSDGTVMFAEDGDMFLLCCDGMHDFCPWDKFREIVLADISLELKIRMLGQASIDAMGAAGKDNITMIGWVV